jgi:hypothetical protein
MTANMAPQPPFALTPRRPISKFCITALVILSALCSANAATYYIDYDAGSDTNSGTSKSAPWKKQPFMQHFGGSYTHSPGDKFIFKGGVTWPNECWSINPRGAGGVAGNPDYYGVDQSWFTGSSWTRPHFDAQGQEFNGGFDVMVFALGNYVTFDNIDFTGLYWNGPKQDAWVIYIHLQSSTYIHITNCVFRNWSHGNAVGTSDTGMCIRGSSVAPFSMGCLVDHCLFDGQTIANSTSGQSSMYANYLCPGFTNNVVRNCSNGTVGSVVTFGNNISNICLSFAPGVHTNATESLGGNPELTCQNVIHNIHGSELTLTQGPETGYYINNVFYDTGGKNIGLDTAWGAGGNAYVFGNTLVISGSAISGATRTPKSDSGQGKNSGTGLLGTLVARNNLVITSNTNIWVSGFNANNVFQNGSLVVAPLVAAVTNGYGTQVLNTDHNVLLTPAAAATLGYTSANGYLPPVNPGSGVNYASVVNGIPNTINGIDVTGIKAQLLKDTNGNPRTAWTIGAYEFGGAAPAPTPTPVPTATPGGSVTPTPTATPIPTATPLSTPTPIPAPSATPPSVLGLLFNSTDGLINPPFVANSDNTISQTSQTVDPTQGGSAIYNFNVPVAGDYVVAATVSAPNGGANSFFIDIDSQPLAPVAIWDVLTTSGFEQRIASWRGNGNDADNEFAPKVFTLTQGMHALIIRGRESGTKLGQISISKLPIPPGNLRPVVGP